PSVNQDFIHLTLSFVPYVRTVLTKVKLETCHAHLVLGTQQLRHLEAPTSHNAV
ncbi:signal peptide, CUB and EGF domain-containing protein 2, partial [Biomphalaria glabrata]